MILDSDNLLVPSGIATLYASARQTGGSARLWEHPQGRPFRLGIMGVMSNENAVTAKLPDKENWIDA